MAKSNIPVTKVAGSLLKQLISKVKIDGRILVHLCVISYILQMMQWFYDKLQCNFSNDKNQCGHICQKHHFIQNIFTFTFILQFLQYSSTKNVF